MLLFTLTLFDEYTVICTILAVCFAFWVLQRFLSPEEKGLRFHTQGTLRQKCNADEENVKG